MDEEFLALKSFLCQNKSEQNRDSIYSDFSSVTLCLKGHNLHHKEICKVTEFKADRVYLARHHCYGSTISWY